MIINDWNPDLYLKFDKERIQPSIDLISRIDFQKPRNIIDIGCGPGNSTQALTQRWHDSAILGIDNSPSMIEKAKKDYPNQNWSLLDANTDIIEGKYDIVFSNATIQWIPNHSELLIKFHNLLSDIGIIAIQLPLFWNMPIGKSILRVSKNSKWSSSLNGVSELFTIHDYSFYYNNLSALYHNIEIWETKYVHILDSQLSILEMIKSTGLKPFLDKLENDEDKEEFENMVMEEIKINYPLQHDGKVLFTFDRLFFIAKK